MAKRNIQWIEQEGVLLKFAEFVIFDRVNEEYCFQKYGLYDKR